MLLGLHTSQCVTGTPYLSVCYWDSIPLSVLLGLHTSQCVTGTAIPLSVLLGLHTSQCVTGTPYLSVVLLGLHTSQVCYWDSIPLSVSIWDSIPLSVLRGLHASQCVTGTPYLSVCYWDSIPLSQYVDLRVSETDTSKQIGTATVPHHFFFVLFCFCFLIGKSVMSMFCIVMMSVTIICAYMCNEDRLED